MYMCNNFNIKKNERKNIRIILSAKLTVEQYRHRSIKKNKAINRHSQGHRKRRLKFFEIINPDKLKKFEFYEKQNKAQTQCKDR